MRIIHIIDSLCLGGGAERMVFNICNELATRHNISVAIFVLHDSTYYNRENHDSLINSLNSNITYKVCNSVFNFSIFAKSYCNTENLDKAIDAFHPDIIHTHLLKSEVLARCSLRTNVKYFSHCHDNLPILKNSLSSLANVKLFVSDFFLNKWLQDKYVQLNNNFISISDDTYNYFNKYLNTKISKNIVSLKNCINTTKFQNNIERKVIDSETICFVSIGSLVAKKNHIFLIKIMRKLIKYGYKVQLTLIGSGPEDKSIKEQISFYNLENEVILVGNTDDVSLILEKSHIYLHSANYEPFGLAIIEAMASGLPIVSLDGKGNRNLIKKRINGFLIKDDENKFVAAILLLIRNKSLYNSISKQNKLDAKQYDVSIYVDKLLGIYEDSISNVPKK
jgi:glycosyltransferase involved in cell wall biosynthesis